MRAKLHHLGALLLVAQLAGAQPPVDLVHIGMTPEQVRAAVGQPQRVARQVLYGRYQEMWTYPTALRVEFNCLKGQPARVINVQSDTFVKP